MIKIKFKKILLRKMFCVQESHKKKTYKNNNIETDDCRLLFYSMH